jgi:hypothetical protein
VVINGWVQEKTAFEAITDYTLAGHVYEDRALNVAAHINGAMSTDVTSTSMTTGRHHPGSSKQCPIDLLPKGRVAVDREVILELCAHAPPATTTALLAALQATPQQATITNLRTNRQHSHIHTHSNRPQQIRTANPCSNRPHQIRTTTELNPT